MVIKEGPSLWDSSPGPQDSRDSCATAEHVRAGEETPEGIMVDSMTILLNTKRRLAEHLGQGSA
jgi:hypothetical protein